MSCSIQLPLSILYHHVLHECLSSRSALPQVGAFSPPYPPDPLQPLTGVWLLISALPCSLTVTAQHHSYQGLDFSSVCWGTRAEAGTDLSRSLPCCLQLLSPILAFSYLSHLCATPYGGWGRRGGGQEAEAGKMPPLGLWHTPWGSSQQAHSCPHTPAVADLYGLASALPPAVGPIGLGPQGLSLLPLPASGTATLPGQSRSQRGHETSLGQREAKVLGTPTSLWI